MQSNSVTGGNWCKVPYERHWVQKQVGLLPNYLIPARRHNVKDVPIQAPEGSADL